jgi:hypothetical protein
VGCAKNVQALVTGRKKARSNDPLDSAATPTTPSSKEVPTDLYGLIKKSRKVGMIKLPPITKVGDRNKGVKEAAAQCLFELLSSELFVIPMAPVDEHWMSPQQCACHVP